MRVIKPKKNKKSFYYGKEQEQSVIKYLSSKDPEERSIIYERELKPVFKTMIESIIRKYRFYLKNETYEETFLDAESFLISKMDLFEPDQNKKSYSYYGTIVKNYCLQKKIKEDAKLKCTTSFDDISNELNESHKYSYDPELNPDPHPYAEWIPFIYDYVNTTMKNKPGGWYNQILFNMYIIDKLSMEKIADKIDVPLSSIIVQIRQIKKEIREAIAHEIIDRKRIRT
jgi:hypothetical protein